MALGPFICSVASVGCLKKSSARLHSAHGHLCGTLSAQSTTGGTATPTLRRSAARACACSGPSAREERRDWPSVTNSETSGTRRSTTSLSARTCLLLAMIVYCV